MRLVEELEVARNELAGCEGADAVTRSQRRRSDFSSLPGPGGRWKVTAWDLDEVLGVLGTMYLTPNLSTHPPGKLEMMGGGL